MELPQFLRDIVANAGGGPNSLPYLSAEQRPSELLGAPIGCQPGHRTPAEWRLLIGRRYPNTKMPEPAVTKESKAYKRKPLTEEDKRLLGL
ncbi:hypothetical protein A2188_02400 [Candidatus Woesebacteria bacterium RIFOXYA1_FULL_43_9]|uniref:Uncharacterized protein n=1 Tax=Candidatus Woesebacteria bacterium RIFOXYA1_FULL_43_9 TaxID=1802534 RepID=A0A1F8CKE6_9BACT|nr:MAG: hypothetical protein A2188_02400 [Candidatus Woesebacteria bacterium RIFOXYA1_FULL_43_9]